MSKESAAGFGDEWIGVLRNDGILDEVPECWKLELSIACEAVGYCGCLLSLHSGGKPCLVVEGMESGIECRIYTDAKEQPVMLKIPAVSIETEAGAEIMVVYLSYKAELYCNGKLMDEDWPLGAFGRADMKVRIQQDAVKAARLGTVKGNTESSPAVTGSFTGPAEYWTPPGFNTSVGDCMPFSDGGRFHLFYLLDRRGHRSKYGLGAHQWAHISTADLKSWDMHPMAVAIDRQWEGSICTGTVFQDQGVYYAYYAVRMSDGSAARLSWATSADGINFNKSEKYFTLSSPYEPVSARDPFVFKDNGGLYHMLVTTSIMKEGATDGCLAHLVSEDLENWKQLDPFVVEGGHDQPECSDYFFQNGWYYLIFSLYGVARYRMSKGPFGPWIKPEQDILDGLRYRVPKTAAFRDSRRLAVGFLSSRVEGYGGCAIFREIIQRQDGTLTTDFVEEVMPAGRPANCPVTEMDTEGGRIVRLGAMPERFRLSLKILYNAARYPCMKLDFQNGGTTRSLYLRLNIQSHTVEMAEEDDKNSFTELLSMVKFGTGIGVELAIFDGIAEMSLDCGNTAVVRLPENMGLCSSVELSAESGDIQFHGISILEL